LRRRLAEITQQAGQAAVAAEDGDAHGIPRAQIGGRGQGGVRLGLEGFQVVGDTGGGHGSVPYVERAAFARRPRIRVPVLDQDRCQARAAWTFWTMAANVSASS